MTTPRYPGTNLRPRRDHTVLIRNADGYHFGTVTRVHAGTVTVANIHRTTTVPISDVAQVQLGPFGLGFALRRLARLFRR